MERRNITLAAVLTLLMAFPVLSMGCLDDDDQSKEVRVDYSGYWSGTIEDDDGWRDVYGMGYQKFTVTGSTIKVMVVKEDDGTSEMVVSIVKDGKIESRKSTLELCGKITMHHSFK